MWEEGVGIYDTPGVHNNFPYMGWVQVTLGVTLKSYTFFKLLDLSRFNGKKKILPYLLSQSNEADVN